MIGKSAAIAIALYFLVGAAFFLPVLLNPNNVYLGSFGDMGIYLGVPVYLNHNLQQGIQSTRTELLNAPFGADISQFGGPFVFVSVYLLTPLVAATSPLFAYNLAMFLALPLSAAAMYFLARHFLQSRHACFIAGLVYGFSAYLVGRIVVAHLNLAYGALLPLYILALFRFNEKRSYPNAFFLAACLALVGLFSYYFLYFALIFTGIFYLYMLWEGRNTLGMRAQNAARNPVQFIAEQKHYLAAVAAFLVIFSVTILPLFLTIASQSESSTFRGAFGARTSLMNAVYLSAWPHHFFVPSVFHPVFKPILVPLFVTFAPIYIGMTALALSLIAVIREKENKVVRFFLFAAISLFILAIGPFMRYVPFLGLTFTVVPALLVPYSYYTGHKRLAKAFALAFAALLFFPILYPVLLPIVQGPAADLTGLEQLKTASFGEIIEHFEKYSCLPIPMPSFFLFLAARVFRSFIRLDIVLMLCVAVLTGFGVQRLLQRVQGNRKHFITGLFFVLILLEVIIFPPYMVTDASETPAEYQWLASQSGQPIVLEYPIDWDDFYMFYQSRHMKPIMNGRYSGEFDKLKKHILDPTDGETLSILAGFQVKYIITHDDWFLSQIPDNFPNKRIMLSYMPKDKSLPFARELDQEHESLSGIRLVKEFEHAKVYEITAEPVEFALE